MMVKPLELLCFMAAVMKVGWTTTDIANEDLLVVSFANKSNLYYADVTMNNFGWSQNFLQVSPIPNGEKLQFGAFGIYNKTVYAATVQNESFIGMWKCTSETNSNDGLPFEGYFTKYNAFTNSGLQDPYALSFYQSNNDENGFLYTSTLDINSVLAFGESGEPVFTDSYPWPGAVVTYPGSDDVYGIAIDNTNHLLFVARKYANVISVYDISNHFKHLYNITNGEEQFEPVGLALKSSTDSNILYATDYSGHQIFAFNISKSSYSLLWESSIVHDMKNPTAVAIGTNDVLYSVPEIGNSIVQFNASTGDYLYTLVEFGSDYKVLNLWFAEAGTCVT